MFNEDELLALLFEIASVGIVNKEFADAPAIFTDLMNALPALESPLIGRATFLLLQGQYKAAVDLLDERRKLIKEPSLAFDVTFAQAISLCGRVGEAERLLIGLLKDKKDTDSGVSFAKSVLKDIQGSSNVDNSGMIYGRSF